jgi:hypothetical protein
MDRSSGTHSFKEFLETASGSFGEILKPKIRLAKNLAMVEELSDIMKAFSVLRTGMDVSMALPLLVMTEGNTTPNRKIFALNHSASQESVGTTGIKEAVALLASLLLEMASVTFDTDEGQGETSMERQTNVCVHFFAERRSWQQ